MTAPPSAADDELVVVRNVVDVGVPLRTRLVAGGAIILAGLVCIFAWGLGANPGDADFGLRTVSDAIALPDITIPAGLCSASRFRASSTDLGVKNSKSFTSTPPDFYPE